MEFKESKNFKSKFEEWKYGEWRKGTPKTFVTLDTEIPEMPEKITEKPSEEQFKKKEKDIMSKIQDITKGLDQKQEEFN